MARSTDGEIRGQRLPLEPGHDIRVLGGYVVRFASIVFEIEEPAADVDLFVCRGDAVAPAWPTI